MTKSTPFFAVNSVKGRFIKTKAVEWEAEQENVKM
jgi:hypothetical protein